MSATDAGNVTAVVMPDVTGPVTTSTPNEGFSSTTEGHWSEFRVDAG